MKIKRYPGKAVDASLSLDQTNAMGLLYEANWLQAHETMKTALGRGTKMRIDNDKISNLSKYQVTLEQLHDLEVDPKDHGVVDTIKELNGYRTTAVRKKQSRKHYPDWDDFREEINGKRNENHYVLDPTEKKQFRPRQQVPEENFQLPPIPDFSQKNLKRSQTVSYRPSNNTVIDIKDLKKMWKAEEPVRQMRMPPPPPPPVPITCDNENTQQRISAAPTKPVNRAKSVRIGSVTTISEDHLPPKPPPRRTLPLPMTQEPSASPTFEFEQRERRKPGSSSSSNSDDQFSIPRPRLIVPVHTYARKRRTGNLLNGSETVESPPPSPKKTIKMTTGGKGLYVFIYSSFLVFSFSVIIIFFKNLISACYYFCFL